MDLGPSSESSGLAKRTPSGSGLRGVRALVLVGGRPAMEHFGEFPLALLDVLGRSVLMRTLDRIRSTGVSEIAVLSDSHPLPPHPAPASRDFTVASPGCFWDEALQLFRSLSRQSECVLVLRLGAWAEVDLAGMVNEHLRSGTAITRAQSAREEALDVFAISSGSQSEAAALFRGELRDERIAVAMHKTSGYVNLLPTPASLRTLTLDAFAGECAIRPCGRERRPGVWIGRGARVHRHTRIVAPAFIGSFCNVRRAAIVTRGSSLEHHSEVDCATVIDNSSIMPYTRVGAGLDMEYSIAGFNQVHSLKHNVTLAVEDPLLLGSTRTHFSARLLTAASWLFSFMPDALWKLLSEPRPEPALDASREAMAPSTLAPSTPTLGDPALPPVKSQSESHPEMAAARRYGNE